MNEIGPFLSLTPHEHHVLSMIVSGMINREIAARLGCREQTVKNAVSVILKKPGRGFALI